MNEHQYDLKFACNHFWLSCSNTMQVHSVYMSLNPVKARNKIDFDVMKWHRLNSKTGSRLNCSGTFYGIIILLLLRDAQPLFFQVEKHGLPQPKDFPVRLLEIPNVTCESDLDLLILVQTRPETSGARTAIR